MIRREWYAKNSLVLVVAAGCAILGGLFAICGYNGTWRLWNLPGPLTPTFADARVITAGAESHALGYDPLLHNPRDPWGRPMNYPRIWQLLFYLGINQQDTIYFGITFALLFFLGLFLATGVIGPPAARLMGFCIFSPAVLLALQRGNTDLVIFFLLALSIRVMKRFPGASAALLGFAFVLKLYPVFAIAIFLRESKQRVQRVLAAGFLIGCVYATAMHHELGLIRLATPDSSTPSYGLAAIWMQPAFGPHLRAAAALLRAASSAIAALIALVAIFHAGHRVCPEVAQSTHMDAFRVGASIYIGTFLIGLNFDYRLVFLLFTVPQLWSWMQTSEHWIRSIAGLTMTYVVVSLWSIFAGRPLIYVLFGAIGYGVIDFCAKGAVFVGLLYLLAYSCPDWIKVAVFRRKCSLEGACADGAGL